MFRFISWLFSKLIQSCQNRESQGILLKTTISLGNMDEQSHLRKWLMVGHYFLFWKNKENLRIYPSTGPSSQGILTQILTSNYFPWQPCCSQYAIFWLNLFIFIKLNNLMVGGVNSVPFKLKFSHVYQLRFKLTSFFTLPVWSSLVSRFLF